MRCPFCKGDDTKVTDSRATDDGNAIRRRRECLKCGRRFTTYEMVEEVPLIVIKKNGSRELFDRSKILNGLLRACNKRMVTRQQKKSSIGWNGKYAIPLSRKFPVYISVNSCSMN